MSDGSAAEHAGGSGSPPSPEKDKESLVEKTTSQKLSSSASSALGKGMSLLKGGKSKTGGSNRDNDDDDDKDAKDKDEKKDKEHKEHKDKEHKDKDKDKSSSSTKKHKRSRTRDVGATTSSPTTGSPGSGSRSPPAPDTIASGGSSGTSLVGGSSSSGGAGGTSDERPASPIRERPSSPSLPPGEIDWAKLKVYFRRMATMLPEPFQSQETNRMMLLYFIVGGAELLGTLDDVFAGERRQATIDWIYSQQVVPKAGVVSLERCGFRGSPWCGSAWNPSCTPASVLYYDQAHIVMTYTALAMLHMLGDDLSRVNRTAVLQALEKLQRPDGSFVPVGSAGAEADVRFVYCAAAICSMLGSFATINKARAVDFVLSARSWDAAFSQTPSQESQGGSTYCAVAALHLLDALDKLEQRERIVHWCLERQVSGFCGRVNKDADVCYSYWIGGTLSLLDPKAVGAINGDLLRLFIASAQFSHGGIAKCAGEMPDPLHSFFAITGLSLIGVKRDGDVPLPKMDYALGVAAETGERARAVAERLAKDHGDVKPCVVDDAVPEPPTTHWAPPSSSSASSSSSSSSSSSTTASPMAKAGKSLSLGFGKKNRVH